MNKISQCALTTSESCHSDNTPVVFIVDDDVSIRESLESLICYAGWQPKAFASAEEFLACPPILAPGCLVLDVMLPDLNGLDLQRLLTNRSELPIIFMTGFAEIPMIVRAMKDGAVEFLTKPFDEQVLLTSIRQAIDNSHAVLRHQSETETLRARYESLTARESEVMALVVTGLLNKAVGRELGISEATVKAHRSKVMRKMGACSLPELVSMTAQLGLA